MKKRSKADHRRAALKSLRTRVRSSQIRASKSVIAPGERVRISWKAFGKSVKVGRVDVKKSGYRDFFPEDTTGYTLTVRGYNQVSIRRVVVEVEKPEEPIREYFVFLIFKTRKSAKEVTRRLYEAIVTLHDGATEDEILKAYQEKVQQEHPQLHNAEIERLLFGPNRGRTINIVPRDTIGSDVPSGSVRVNDARKPTKGKLQSSRHSSKKRSKSNKKRKPRNKKT